MWKKDGAVVNEQCVVGPPNIVAHAGQPQNFVYSSTKAQRSGIIIKNITNSPQVAPGSGVSKRCRQRNARSNELSGLRQRLLRRQLVRSSHVLDTRGTCDGLTRASGRRARVPGSVTTNNATRFRATVGDFCRRQPRRGGPLPPVH